MNPDMSKLVFVPLLMAAFAAIPVQAQLWCPPGAAWTANLTGLAVDGCETAVYMGDTLYEGRPAKHIAVEDIIMNYLSPPQDTVVWDLYTNETDSIIYQWTDTEGWDTLYWFNAVPGNRWYPPGLPIGQSELCNAVQVTDTAHVGINGTSLRKLTCAFLDQFGNVTSNTFSITERFGTGSMHFPAGACVTDEPAWMPHTYVDNAFPFYDNGAGSYCDHFSGIAQHGSPLNIALFPNPGTIVLHIEADGREELLSVQLRDVYGRLCLRAHPHTNHTALDVQLLSPGCYTVEVRTPQGRRLQRWMKQ